MSFFNKKNNNFRSKNSPKNVRSLCATTTKLAIKKVLSILNQKADIYILVSVRINENEFSKLINHETLKYKMASYDYWGSFCKNKGVIVLYKKVSTEIKNFKNHIQGQLISFQARINVTYVNFVPVYGPPEGDNPNFFLTAKSILDSMDGDYGLILGDFNTTMDPVKDRYGYLTDNHKKADMYS